MRIHTHSEGETDVSNPQASAVCVSSSCVGFSRIRPWSRDDFDSLRFDRLFPTGSINLGFYIVSDDDNQQRDRVDSWWLPESVRATTFDIRGTRPDGSSYRKPRPVESD